MVRMSGERDGTADTADVEITPEMIEAGIRKLRAHEGTERFIAWDDRVVKDIFIAMLRASRRAESGN